MEEYLSEKEQWEWLKSQVRENATSVVLAVAVVIIAVAGWRWWQARNDGARVAASDTYAQMVKSLGDRGKALAALGVLERDYPSTPYADQGRLLAARIYVDDGELDRAATELTAVMQGSKDHDLSLVARARLARVQIAQGKAEAAIATLDGAGKDTGAFAATWHEIRGDALLARSDRAGALREYRLAQSTAVEQPSELLSLKIADLASDAPAPAAASIAAADAASGNVSR
ncbi:MAG: tetratricopeptide repeat protein [Proteobacteria bacterium]|nr:tetratricopeptide repeat protein [Pseudomonadota bacterium]